MFFSSAHSQVSRAQAIAARISARLANLPEHERSLLAADVEALSGCLAEMAEQAPAHGAHLNAAQSADYRPASESLSMQMLKEVIDWVSNGVLVYDRNLNILLANKKMLEYCGYDPTGTNRSALLARLQFVSEQGRVATEAGMQPRQSKTEVFDHDHSYTIINEHGQKFQVLVTVWPLMVGNEMVGAYTVLSDMTQQANLQKENRFKTELLEAIFQAEPSGLVVITVDDLTVQMANQAYRAMTCSPNMDPVGRTIEMLWSKQDASKASNYFQEMIRTGEPMIGEYEYTYPDGSWRNFSVHVRPLHWDNRPAVLMVHWEITQLKQSVQEAKLREDLLRESEIRFRTALASGAISVYSFDRDLRFTWLYDAHFGTKTNSAIGKRNDEILPPEDVAELEALKRSVIETGQGVRREIGLNVRGEWHVYDTLFEPLRNANGEVTGLTGAAMDITERRWLENKQVEYAARMDLHRRLVALRRLERKQVAQRIYDGPLQEIISLVFAAEMARELSQDQALLELMDEITDRSKRLVSDLSQVYMELNPPDVTQTGLMRAVESRVEDLKKKYPAIQFHLILMEDLLKLPDAIGLVLFHIFQESVINAIRHSQAADIWVRLNLTPEQVILEVEDNGVGFTSSSWIDFTRAGCFGLVSMKEEAESIQAALEILSGAGGGVRVRVTALLGEAAIHPDLW